MKSMVGACQCMTTIDQERSVDDILLFMCIMRTAHLTPPSLFLFARHAGQWHATWITARGEDAWKIGGCAQGRVDPLPREQKSIRWSELPQLVHLGGKVISPSIISPTAINSRVILISILLFNLSRENRGGEIESGYSCHSALANIVAPLLLSRCRELLEQFLVDDRQHGNCPLPKYAHAYVLRYV